VTGSRRWYWPIGDFDASESGVELRNVCCAFSFVDLQLVQVIVKAVFSRALPTKDVDIVVDHATRVAVPALWNVS